MAAETLAGVGALVETIVIGAEVCEGDPVASGSFSW